MCASGETKVVCTREGVLVHFEQTFDRIVLLLHLWSFVRQWIRVVVTGTLAL